MTNELAQRYLLTLPIYKSRTGPLAGEVKKQYDARNMGIKALQALNALTDKPCEVCKYHTENSCTYRGCVFEGLTDANEFDIAYIPGVKVI